MRLLKYVFEEIGLRAGRFSTKYLAQTLFAIGYWTVSIVILGEVFEYFDRLDKANAVPGGVLASALVLIIAVVFVIFAFLFECLISAKRRIAEENAELIDNIRNPK